MTRYRAAGHGCLLALFLAAAASASVAAAQDNMAYQNACGDCHPSQKALARKIEGETAEQKRAFLAEFLQRHHLPDSGEIDAIIDYLVAESMN